jgi:hypothetical protein
MPEFGYMEFGVLCKKRNTETYYIYNNLRVGSEGETSRDT